MQDTVAAATVTSGRQPTTVKSDNALEQLTERQRIVLEKLSGANTQLGMIRSRVFGEGENTPKPDREEPASRIAGLFSLLDEIDHEIDDLKAHVQGLDRL